MADRTKTDSLDIFKRSYLGSIHKIWSRLPLSLLMKGEKYGWRKITKKCKEFITGKTEMDTTINQCEEKKLKIKSNSR